MGVGVRPNPLCRIGDFVDHIFQIDQFLWWATVMLHLFHTLADFEREREGWDIGHGLSIAIIQRKEVNFAERIKQLMHLGG